jgi:YesN/AraC family two-component response regulator
MLLLLLKPDIYYAIGKYRSSNLDENTKKEYLRKLNDYMEGEKPYLNPEISLDAIASSLSLNRRNLSQVINELCKNNFKGYINEFRIRESIKLLSSTEYDKKTILEILYEVGFNSKSVFNDQFKKTTGLTPQEFRLKQNNTLSEKYFAVDSYN